MTGMTNEEVLKTIQVIFANFKKLRTSEAATLYIPHLVDALKSDSEAAQESSLDTLYLLKSDMNEDVAKSQALVTVEAIPILQLLVNTCPPSFHDDANKVLSEGVYNSLFSLNHYVNQDWSSWTLKIEIVSSNRTSID